AAAMRSKPTPPAALVCPGQGSDELGSLIAPNATVLIAGAPHPEAGKRLIDYLLSKDTERKLALSDAAQIPLHPGVTPPAELRSIESIKVMNVNYAEVATKLQAIQPFLKDWVAGE